MNQTALFIRHKALPGKRDALQGIWETFVKPRAEVHPAHKAYFFCYDYADPDVVSVFQLYDHPAALDEFLSGDWYSDYLREVADVVVAPPELTHGSLVWAKSLHWP